MGSFIPSVLGNATIIFLSSKCGSLTTSGAVKTGPEATFASASKLEVSDLVWFSAHFSKAGMISECKCSPQPVRSSKRESPIQSGLPIKFARFSN